MKSRLDVDDFDKRLFDVDDFDMTHTYKHTLAVDDLIGT